MPSAWQPHSQSKRCLSPPPAGTVGGSGFCSVCPETPKAQHPQVTKVFLSQGGILILSPCMCLIPEGHKGTSIHLHSDHGGCREEPEGFFLPSGNSQFPFFLESSETLSSLCLCRHWAAGAKAGRMAYFMKSRWRREGQEAGKKAAVVGKNMG